MCLYVLLYLNSTFHIIYCQYFGNVANSFSEHKLSIKLNYTGNRLPNTFIKLLFG